MENFLMDLVSDASLAETVIAKVRQHTTRLALATAAAGVDVLCMYDDAGMQTGLQLSPALWRRYVKPAWRHVLGTVRSQFPHVKFFLHSCGKIDAIVADIIELGFDILHPIQPECMDFEAMWTRFGSDVVLAATLSSQKLFPFGTPAEIRREVNRLAEIVGDQRRAILMPSNVIQPETPWENVVAFAEAARELQTSR
jgi:uroporphyrinogen decarboxylase